MHLHLHLLGAALIGLGLAIAAHAWRERRLAEQSQRWPSTYGTIVHSQVVHERRSSTNSPQNLFKADVRYTYTVDSKEHQGSSVTVGGDLSTSNRERAEQRVRMYPAGSSVTVFYEPARPETSCLERRQEGAGVLYAVAAGFCLAGALVMAGLVGR